MKSIRFGSAARRAASAAITGIAIATVAVAGGCGGGSSGAGSPATSAVPAPVPLGDVERATFASSLDVHLDRMVRRPSGLYVQDLVSGTGAVATRGRTVVVRYTGWLPNGTSFDSGEITVTLGSNKTIRAWEDGLLGMRVGGKRRLVVPPSMGYGASGEGEIPPNSVLVFEMEMTTVF
jgi:FKBP-type peptidyl-prolyl cis-trans isomerase FkpA